MGDGGTQGPASRCAGRPTPSPSRRNRAIPASAAIVLAVLSAVSTLAGAVGASSAGAPSTPPSPLLVSDAGAVSSFASGGGYSAANLARLEGSRPATGAVPVELTFIAPLSPTAYGSAVAYFRGQGLSVTSIDPSRLTLGLVGPAGRVGEAFSTHLLAGRYDGSPARLPEEPPALPPGLAEEVAGVVGLSSGVTTFSIDLQPSALGRPGPASPAILPGTITPALARQFYGFSSLYNLSGGPSYPVNESIAIVLWGPGYAPSDIEHFLASDYPSPPFPLPTIRAYPVAGAPRPSNSSLDEPDSKAVEELTLDIEWAVSMAPGATIDVVYAPGGLPPDYSPSTVNLTAALSEAISLSPEVISMSFGTDENSDGSLVAAWTPLFQEAASRGITLLAATGDTGGDTTVCSGTPAPEYPASSPGVVAVGGSAVAVSFPFGGSPTFSETAWNDSGGGFSTQFAAPSWQEVGSAAAPISATGHRGMPDVSGSAENDFLYYNGSDDVGRGTSFATPIWAGLVADIDAKWQHALGFFTPSLYHVGAGEATGQIGIGVAGVSGGGNCVADATTGWNAVTGWGSPRAAVLYDDLLGSFVNISLSVDRTTVAPGGSISVAAQLTNRTTGAPIAGVPVNLSLAADTDLGPCTGTFQTATPTSNASGWASATLSVPICYLGEHALVNASVTTTRLYGTSGLRVDVNLLGVFPALSFLTQPPWVFITYSVTVGAAAVLGAWIGRPREPSAPSGPPVGVGGAPGPLAPAPPSPPSGVESPPLGAPPSPGPPPTEGEEPPRASPPPPVEPTEPTPPESPPSPPGPSPASPNPPA